MESLDRLRGTVVWIPNICGGERGLKQQVASGRPHIVEGQIIMFNSKYVGTLRSIVFES
jgi:hypothetical protein